MSRNPELTLIPEMSQGLDDVLKTRLVSQTGSATLIKCQDINERKCSTNPIKYAITINPADAVSTTKNKIHDDDVLTMKTFIASCLLLEYHDVAGTVCADVQEQSCQDQGRVSGKLHHNPKQVPKYQ